MMRSHAVRRGLIGFCIGAFLVLGLGIWQPLHSQETIPVEELELTPVDYPLNPETDSPGNVPDGLTISPLPSEDQRAVIGQDDRVLTTSRAYPWSAVGRVEQYDRRGQLEGWCTGTLIARSIVLTNAHCVVDQRTNQLTGNEIVFRPNVIAGRASDRAKAVSVEYGTNFADQQIQDDWAVISLDEPLGDYYGELGWIVPALERPDVIELLRDKIHLLGYSSDFPRNAVGHRPGESPGLHRNCSIVGLSSDNRLLHDCDTNPGASGAALLARLENGNYIILGIHAGSAQRTDGTVINYGMQVDRWKSAAREMISNSVRPASL